MKLKFTRNQSGDVEAEILRGTTMEPFNYIEMHCCPEKFLP